MVIFTALETAKANGLNPELNHILTVLPDRFALNPEAAIDDLLPWTADMHRSFFGGRIIERLRLSHDLAPSADHGPLYTLLSGLWSMKCLSGQKSLTVYHDIKLIVDIR